MAKISQAGLYIIKQDEDGNVLIFLPKPEGEKQKPIIIYDGKDHALFVRNAEQSIILDYVNPEVRDVLNKAEAVFIIEVVGQDIADSYESVVRHVDRIPLNWQKYGLKTWEEVKNLTKI